MSTQDKSLSETSPDTASENIAVTHEVADIPVIPIVSTDAVEGVDDVYLASCVYKNVYAQKSRTVHHLQRRLGELGFDEANSDMDGYYGDLTANSIKLFQEANGHAGTGRIDADTFSLVFHGDSGVRVIL